MTLQHVVHIRRYFMSIPINIVSDHVDFAHVGSVSYFLHLISHNSWPLIMQVYDKHSAKKINLQIRDSYVFEIESENHVMQVSIFALF